MSEYILPAERLTKALGLWLNAAMNDHGKAMIALQGKDEEEHKAALMVATCYLFALNAASDALYSTDPIPDEINKTLISPEKRVMYFAQNIIDGIEEEQKNTLALGQPHLPGLGE